MDNLNDNKLDKAISITTSILGEFPGGSIISEIVRNVIPNQRIDRIINFLRKLENRLGSLEEVAKINFKKQEEYITLLENGMFYAYRASSDKRLEYIASVVKNGLTQDQIEISRYVYLLNLLSELNDEEIIWLRYYLFPTLGGDQEFRERHKDILSSTRSYIEASEEELNKSAIQDSYKEHLERLGLVDIRIKMDRKTNIPIYDKFSGKPEGYKHITHLGKMLLKEIGFTEAL